MKILTIGDIVGTNGCEFLREKLPSLKKEKCIDIVIANGENSAQGNGILPSSAEYILNSGVDLITTGNHVYRRKEIYDYLEEDHPLIRPANYDENNPGKGMYILDMGSVQVAVINIMGVVYMENLENPFMCAERMVELAKNEGCKIILIDFHAETTAEKRALGFHLDGQISALFGTHTHVQTADEQILPNGSGYITDLGMTGPINSVLGVTPELAIEKLRTNMPVRFLNPDTPCMLNGCIFEIDKITGKTISVERVNIV
ncbi:MAG: TIGR00282 family metallophosphoesterase [Clostridiales bacterium]|nr:TIGR00282 family metallophosphoesterase [Clostridiales bacterium]